MKAAISLMVVLATAMLLTYGGRPGHPSTALAVGVLILGGWLAGLLCRKINIPAVTGYLVLGGLIGPYALGLIAVEQIQHDLQFAGDLAVALIGLIAGGEIHLSHLRGQGRRLAVLIGVHVAVLLTVVMGALVLGRLTVGLFAEVPDRQFAVIVLLLGTVTLAASPAVVVAMISEYRAAGPMSRMAMILSVLKDLLLVILFAVALSVGKAWLGGGRGLGAEFLVAIAAQLVGSVVVGVMLGLLMAIYARRITAHLVIFTIGGCMFIALLGEVGFAVAGHAIHLEPLLMALNAGLVMRNIWPEETETLFEAVEATSLPVYCLFFALAGAAFDPRQLMSLWPMAVGLSVLRLAGLWVSMRAGLAVAGYTEPALQRTWLGLWPQAGVSLVLVVLIEQNFGGAAHEAIARASDVLLCAIFIDQFLGPIGFRWALGRSGEIGKLARRETVVENRIGQPTGDGQP